MEHFDPLFVPLGACPESLTPKLAYPSVTIVFIILGCTSAIFAILTAAKYNSVMVYDRPERKPAISNTWWILYYIGITVRAVIDGTKYALTDQKHETTESLVLIVISLLLYGVCTLMISFALQHQKEFRSKFAFSSSLSRSSTSKASFPTTSRIESSAAINRDSPKTGMCHNLKEKILSVRSIFVILFLIYCGAEYSMFIYREPGDQPYYIFFLVAFGIQRVPVIILVAFIIFSFPENKIEGPLISSRVILLIATILDTVNNLPVTLWAEIIEDPECLFGAISIVDIIHIVFWFAQVLFFLFLRAEFVRNKEQFLYNTVQTRKEYEQYGIDWRHFNDATPSLDSSNN
jgi:hypothetical protein